MNNKFKNLKIFGATLFWLYCMPLVAFAGNYGENIGKWALDQAFWVILGIGVVTGGLAMLKRAWVGGTGIWIATGIICYLCKNPEKLASVGEQIGKTLGI